MHRDSGCIETEEVYGEKWLSLIYGSPLGKIPLWLAIKRSWFSRWYGKRMDSVDSRKRIIPFIEKFNLDEKEFLKRTAKYKNIMGHWMKPSMQNFIVHAKEKNIIEKNFEQRFQLRCSFAIYMPDYRRFRSIFLRFQRGHADD